MSENRVQSFQKRAKELGYDLSVDKCKKLVDYLDQTHFNLMKEEKLDLASLIELLSTKNNHVLQKNKVGTERIPTGIKQLDLDLNGGLPREQLVSILARPNKGKSMFCTSLGSQAAINGYKVLHIQLSGIDNETKLRYISRISNIKYSQIINNDLNMVERLRIKDSILRIKENLIVNEQYSNLNIFVEDLVEKIDSIFKVFPFDMVIVDHGQLLNTKHKSDNERMMLTYVFRSLAAIAVRYNAVVVSPIQSIRTQEFPETLDVLRTEDIEYAFEIARLSGVILSLNMTDDEQNRNKMRIHLEKQRNGVKGKLYGIDTDFARCNLILNKDSGVNNV